MKRRIDVGPSIAVMVQCTGLVLALATGACGDDAGTGGAAGGGTGGHGGSAGSATCEQSDPWSASYTSSLGPSAAGIASDASCRIVLAGDAGGQLDLGGGPLPGGGRLYWAALDAAGRFLMGATFGESVGAWSVGDVAVDPSGNIVLVGSLEGPADLGGGPLPEGGSMDAFVLKLDPDGKHVFSLRFGDAVEQTASRVAVDGGGNIHLLGSYAGSVDLGGGPLQSVGERDLFVAVLGPDGEHQWSASFGSAGWDYPIDIAASDDGKTILYGDFVGDIDFGGGTLAGPGTTYVAAFDSGGAHLWSRRYNVGTENERGMVDVDASGAVVMTGAFGADVDFGGGPLVAQGGLGINDAYIVKLGADGAHLWSRGFGSPGVGVVATSVAIGPSGRLLVSGDAKGPIDLGGGELPVSVGSVFFAAFDEAGAHLWSRIPAGQGESGTSVVGWDAAGIPLLAGLHRGSIDVGSGPMICTEDFFGCMFVAKLEEP